MHVNVPGSAFQKDKVYFLEAVFFDSWQKMEKSILLDLKVYLHRIGRPLRAKCENLTRRSLPPLILLDPQNK